MTATGSSDMCSSTLSAPFTRGPKFWNIISCCTNNNPSAYFGDKIDQVSQSSKYMYLAILSQILEKLCCRTVQDTMFSRAPHKGRWRWGLNAQDYCLPLYSPNSWHAGTMAPCMSLELTGCGIGKKDPFNFKYNLNILNVTPKRHSQIWHNCPRRGQRIIPKFLHVLALYLIFQQCTKSLTPVFITHLSHTNAFMAEDPIDFSNLFRISEGDSNGFFNKFIKCILLI